MELVRRGGELALLDELLASAGGVEGAAVLVTGRSGTGKSALLDAFAARAAQRGARVLKACASPAEESLPFGVVGQLLSGTRRAAREDPYEPGGGPGALHDALCALGGNGPLAVVVDDVQHADEPSARSLLYLCGRLADTGALLVMSGRPDAALPLPLAELFRHPRRVPVRLTTLSEAGVAGFLRGPGAMDAETARRLAADWYRFTGGNPRLLHGLLDDHRACQPVRPARPVAGTAFRRGVVDCLRGAGTAALRTARALAVLGDEATLTLVARFLRVPERAVAAGLEQLDATGLLDGGRLRHAGVRAAALEDLSAEESGLLHARAARVLYDDGAEPPAVAVHLVAAAADGAAGTSPAWAAPLLTEAGGHAMRAGEVRRAAQFLRTAYRAGGDEQHHGMLETLARAEWESDPAAVIRHLPALERNLASGRLDAERTVEAAGLLLWHGRAEQPARAAGTLESSVPVLELRATIDYVRPGAVGEDGGGPDRDTAAEQVLESIVHGHAPPPSVAAVLTLLLHAGETERVAQWCALSAGAGPAQTTPARRAVAAAVAAVVQVRAEAYDVGAGHAERALDLMSPGAWGVAVGMPLAAAVRAATARGAYQKAERLLRVPVPEVLFRSRAGVHYLLARGGCLLASGRARAALRDFHTCRDLLAEWGVEAGEAVDWRGPAAEAVRSLAAGEAGRDPIAVLTRAERRVAVLAADGCTNRGIAARLYVTPSTVEQHLTSVYRKLRVRSRAGLVELVGGRC
ncbi:LuxR family transcriptional regulator [Streptomyces sp. GESEQ-35]|uniref:helix-turn-helix transcriptional regulator n=1 Tax=Streptomyces sp. GESEQ-35 TaxID=2812657 RepID=UPI001B34552A|nr:LuxR family transcriptional regulator [Streptomyces sp. GESEQ-35]